MVDKCDSIINEFDDRALSLEIKESKSKIWRKFELLSLCHAIFICVSYFNCV